MSYSTTGLRVIPGTLTRKGFTLTESMFKRNVDRYRKSQYDIVVIDTQPGVLLPVWSPKYLDEVLAITTPDMPSFTSCMHLTHYLEKRRITYSVVINKITNKRYELNHREIEDIYPKKIIGKLPHDEIVPLSIERRMPAVLLNKRAKFSRRMETVYESMAENIDAR
ncbi:MAG: MinD/ParA family ATP-binding protein [Candidatus Micrarchaeales archaeon]